ncbi:MAG TPA: hypothetical protein VHE34_26050 [Puia sp.]|uniref:hypothetical protein n=1 Tax=Puia sp. TaxID=2045100 RepID=UPI002D0CCDAA|nr:hypothetical protein [Puia sp.]HVU98723.1 hypothetical protein [Puia sp.]
MTQVEAIIIGNGIMARVTSHLMAKEGVFKKALIIGSEALPTASTQNQVWLQSGLIYPLETEKGKREAELCIRFGRRLNEMRLKSMTERFGIMAVASEQEAWRKIDFQIRNGFPQYDHILRPAEVERLLGRDFAQSAHYPEGTCFFKTPDQPFDEGGLLGFCRDSLRSPSSGFSSITGNATLRKSQVARNGYSLVVNGEEYDPGMLFVMAGVSTKQLLAPLGIEQHINIHARRCVLMRAPIITDLSADLFVDMMSHLSVNVVTNGLGEKMCLFGDVQFSLVPDLTQAMTDRDVTDDDKSKFLENLCQPQFFPQLRSRLIPLMKDNANFSVCYKTECDGHLPWIFPSAKFAPEFPNIFVAGPGKATLAWYAAQELLKLAKINIQTGLERPIVLEEPSYQPLWIDQK